MILTDTRKKFRDTMGFQNIAILVRLIVMLKLNTIQQMEDFILTEQISLLERYVMRL